MSETAETLRTLHRIHSQLADLRGTLERLPGAVRTRKSNVAKLEADLKEARELVTQTRKMADSKQLDLKSSEDRIENWKAALNTAASNKEYQTLQEQMAAADMANSVLSDEILEALERVDELEAKAKTAEENLAKGQEDLKQFANESEQRASTLKGDIERLEGELAATEKALPGDFRGEYQRIVSSKGAEGMAGSEDGVCNGCGQSITLNMQNALKLAKPVFCQSCGALLYEAE